MKFWIGVILTAILAAVVERFLPWWSVAIVAFIVAMLAGETKGSSFLMGFLGVGAAWLVIALLHDIANQHILSTRMAKLFHLPHYSFFIAATVLIGGLVGGFSALGGGMMRTSR